jgi:hypothetical protein
MEKLIYEGIEFIIPNKVSHKIRKSNNGITHYNIRKGKIKRDICEICGKEKTDAHHEIYDTRSYKIRWLCHKHHKIIHALFDNKLKEKV